MLDPSDGDLVLRTRQGRLEAYGELVRRHQTSVFNVCYRLMAERAEAEDMAQEAFVRAYQRLATFDTSRPFGPWIRRVAANLCLNRFQRRTPAQVSLEDETDQVEADPSAAPEQARVQQEQAERLRAAILDLPPHDRAVIELRHFHDLSYQSIARTLDMSLSDVKSHLFRARRRLAARLTDHD